MLHSLWVTKNIFSCNSFFNVYFIVYVIIVVPIFPPITPTQKPHSLWQSSHHCSYPWVMPVSSLATPFPILYFTSPLLFCSYLFEFLNPLTSSPIPIYPSPIWHPSNALRIHESVSTLVCLVCFLDSVVDRHVFIAIFLFIVLIFVSPQQREPPWLFSAGCYVLGWSPRWLAVFGSPIWGPTFIPLKRKLPQPPCCLCHCPCVWGPPL